MMAAGFDERSLALEGRSVALFDENLSGWIWAALAVMIAGMLLANEGTRRSLREPDAAG